MVDYGCGKQHLRKYLPPESKYIPVDYISRSADTIVADFNQKPPPIIDGDVAFISGFLEYVEDVPAFIGLISSLSYREIVMSYCTTELIPRMEERKKLGWKNHLNLKDFLAEWLKTFNLHDIGTATNGSPIFRFERKS